MLKPCLRRLSWWASPRTCSCNWPTHWSSGWTTDKRRLGVWSCRRPAWLQWWPCRKGLVRSSDRPNAFSRLCPDETPNRTNSWPSTNLQDQSQVFRPEFQKVDISWFVTIALLKNLIMFPIKKTGIEMNKPIIIVMILAHSIIFFSYNLS